MAKIYFEVDNTWYLVENIWERLHGCLSIVFLERLSGVTLLKENNRECSCLSDAGSPPLSSTAFQLLSVYRSYRSLFGFALDGE